jgi:hypothetical protein
VIRAANQRRNVAAAAAPRRVVLRLSAACCRAVCAAARFAAAPSHRVCSVLSGRSPASVIACLLVQTGGTFGTDEGVGCSPMFQCVTGDRKLGPLARRCCSAANVPSSILRSSRFYDYKNFMDPTKFYDETEMPLPRDPEPVHIDPDGTVNIPPRVKWQYHYLQTFFAAGTHYFVLTDDNDAPALHNLGPEGFVCANGQGIMAPRVMTRIQNGASLVMLHNTGGVTQAWSSLCVPHTTHASRLCARAAVVGLSLRRCAAAAALPLRHEHWRWSLCCELRHQSRLVACTACARHAIRCCG